MELVVKLQLSETGLLIHAFVHEGQSRMRGSVVEAKHDSRRADGGCGCQPHSLSAIEGRFSLVAVGDCCTSLRGRPGEPCRAALVVGMAGGDTGGLVGGRAAEGGRGIGW